MTNQYFKAKSTAGNWVSGILFDDYIIDYFDYINNDYHAYKIDNNTICRESPEKDNMGMILYENDIILLTNNDNYNKYLIIKYGYFVQDCSWGEYTPDECYGFYCVPVNKDDISESRYTSSLKSYVSEDDCILIYKGNIFDNPELLKGESL